MIAIAATTNRVESNTAAHVNREIHRHTAENVACYAEMGRRAIDDRLAELDEEWDIERVLETMAPTITILGLGLGLLKNKKWFALPILVQSFFLQHAIQGWCPPIPLLRRLGVRTACEIDAERNALKALRGDYRRVPTKAKRTKGAAGKALRAAER
jgi:hypothetical protein